MRDVCVLKMALRKMVKNRDIYNSPLYKKLYFPAARFLAMHGWAFPFVEDQGEYWESRKSGDTHGPEKYIQEDNSTYVLFEALLDVVDSSASFLEIGCNAGRNLNYLLRKGYTNLAGIEINALSIHETLRNQFPELCKTAVFYVGNAASEIKKIPDNSFDVTFSIGVLEHIRPQDMSLFEDMVRVTKRYVAVITSENSRVYPYDFEKVFTRLGCKAIVYRLFYGKEHNFRLPRQSYNESEHFFNLMFLRIFVK